MYARKKFLKMLSKMDNNEKRIVRGTIDMLQAVLWYERHSGLTLSTIELFDSRLSQNIHYFFSEIDKVIKREIEERENPVILEIDDDDTPF